MAHPFARKRRVPFEILREVRPGRHGSHRVSGDEDDVHRSFAQKHKLSFSAHQRLRRINAAARLMSKTFGILPGVTYVIDKQGIVRPHLLSPVCLR